MMNQHSSHVEKYYINEYKLSTKPEERDAMLDAAYDEWVASTDTAYYDNYLNDDLPDI